jgi:hypothetical protein
MIYNPINIKGLIAIYDISGRVVRSLELKGHSNMEFNFNPSPGIYLIKISAVNRTFTTKIITH